ncbi:PIN domain-containing protein [uncultured Amnibacterium sp.]|uniref:PIN domain-containing protein n=1 Tax=uncultured Amnibacterium sp. TaxID=1631851 RepID=UPI0035CAC0B3
MIPLALDTSVAVPLMLLSHPMHHAVVARVGGRPIALSGHAEVETLSVLTRLPNDARVDAAAAKQVLTDGMRHAFSPDLDHPVTPALRIADLGITGGAVYDALVALAALDSGATLLTRDARALPTYARVGVAIELVA